MNHGLKHAEEYFIKLISEKFGSVIDLLERVKSDERELMSHIDSAEELTSEYGMKHDMQLARLEQEIKELHADKDELQKELSFIYNMDAELNHQDLKVLRFLLTRYDFHGQEFLFENVRGIIRGANVGKDYISKILNKLVDKSLLVFEAKGQKKLYKISKKISRSEMHKVEEEMEHELVA